MSTVSLTLNENYWEDFTLEESDFEFLYNHMLEAEIPLSPQELAAVLVEERIRREKQTIEQQQSASGDLYVPKATYSVGQTLVFPAFNWRSGQVVGVRPGKNPEMPGLQVLQIEMDHNEKHEFAANLADHALNAPLRFDDNDPLLNPQSVLAGYSENLVEEIVSALQDNPDFVSIAAKWFPRSLLVDIHIGHLNLAEAVLDMAGGGPLPTPALLEQIELSADVPAKLVEFSLDYALQSDPRFDEVGAAGKVLWFLQRLEPAEVLEPPAYLRYSGIEYDRGDLTRDMLALERELDDELSPLQGKQPGIDEVEIRLIYPHWRSGTLPLGSRVRHLFPTAYEAPRIRFTLVDGESGDKFPAWVVREKRYIYGLKDWFAKRGCIPGSIIRVRRGKQPGEVILKVDSRRSAREWVRTVLVGSDGGTVFAMLKQIVQTSLDERMAIAIPDRDGVDQAWLRQQKESTSFEKLVLNMVRELAKLNPQSHVHASELYAALNVMRRCPPGPLLALLATSPNFNHVGDLHFRINEADS